MEILIIWLLIGFSLPFCLTLGDWKIALIYSAIAVLIGEIVYYFCRRQNKDEQFFRVSFALMVGSVFGGLFACFGYGYSPDQPAWKYGGSAGGLLFGLLITPVITTLSESWMEFLEDLGKILWRWDDGSN